MKNSFLLVCALVSRIAIAQIQPQYKHDVPPQPSIQNPILSNSITPEGVLGERKVTADFRMLFTIGQNQPQPVALQSVHLYYSLSETGSIKDNLNPDEARIHGDLGVTPARFVNGRWEVILPHSGNRNGAISTSAIEAKGRQRVFYKWHMVLQGGKNEQTGVRNFTMPRPLNIAIIGDSYSSGEGAPTPSTLWLKPNCHRSENAGEFKAVEQFVANNPHIAVVYKPFFVSCSGAETKHIIGNRYKPGYCDQLGVASPGTEDIQLKQLQNVFAEATKFKEDIQGKIDAVVVSVGGNDIGFGDAVKDAYMNSLSPGFIPPGNISFYNQRIRTVLPASYDELRRFFDSQCTRYVFTTQYPDPTSDERGATCGLPQNLVVFAFFALVESAMQSTRQAAEGLCKAGEALVDFFVGSNNRDDCAATGLFDSPNYEHLLEYIRCNMASSGPDGMASAEVIANGFIDLIRAIVDSNGRFDVFVSSMNKCIPADGRPSDANVFSTLLATQTDIAAAKTGIVLPMSRIMENKVNEFNANGFPNWHFVGGAMDASRNHGICTCVPAQRYFNSLLASFDQQGNMQGTMHMNTRGQVNVYKPIVLTKLQEIITYDARRGMLADVCQQMDPLPPVSPEYANILAADSVNKAKHDEVIQREFEKLYDRIKPVADAIIKGLDPQRFASQYRNREFENMRRARFGR